MVEGATAGNCQTLARKPPTTRRGDNACVRPNWFAHYAIRDSEAHSEADYGDQSM